MRCCRSPARAAFTTRLTWILPLSSNTTRGLSGTRGRRGRSSSSCSLSRLPRSSAQVSAGCDPNGLLGGQDVDAPALRVLVGDRPPLARRCPARAQRLAGAEATFVEVDEREAVLGRPLFERVQ